MLTIRLLISMVLVAGVPALPAVSVSQVPLEEGKTRMSKTYYVDATNGRDSNDGLSPEESWKTVEKVNSAKLHPGDAVLLKRGEVWREQLIPQSGDGCLQLLLFFIRRGDDGLDAFILVVLQVFQFFAEGVGSGLQLENFFVGRSNRFLDGFFGFDFQVFQFVSQRTDGIF